MTILIFRMLEVFVMEKRQLPKVLQPEFRTYEVNVLREKEGVRTCKPLSRESHFSHRGQHERPACLVFFRQYRIEEKVLLPTSYENQGPHESYIQIHWSRYSKQLTSFQGFFVGRSNIFQTCN